MGWSRCEKKGPKLPAGRSIVFPDVASWVRHMARHQTATSCQIGEEARSSVTALAAKLGLGFPEFIVIAVIILCILFLRRGDR